MSRAAAIGAPDRIAGYALAGVEVVAAEGAAQAVDAWRALDRETDLVLLTADVAKALADELAEENRRIWAVLPE